MQLHLESKFNTKRLCVEQPNVSTVRLTVPGERIRQGDAGGGGRDRHIEENPSGRWLQ